MEARRRKKIAAARRTVGMGIIVEPVSSIRLRPGYES
jgi:hypothetical protein